MIRLRCQRRSFRHLFLHLVVLAGVSLDATVADVDAALRRRWAS